MPRHDPLNAAADFLGSEGFSTARFGLILGTGFGACAQAVEQKTVVPYRSIPHFPVSTVQGHDGNLVFGDWGEASAIVMQGRIHLYEGYDIRQIAFPLEVMRRFGVEILILTNAAGGLNPRFEAGDLMVVRDHVHPIGKKWLGELTERSPGDSIYDHDLRESLMQSSIQIKNPVQQGILAWMPGPSFETRAEIALLKSMGADAVTMSTVPEALAGRRLGMRTTALSCISNVWTGRSGETVDTGDVMSTVESSADRCSQLLAGLGRLMASREKT